MVVTSVCAASYASFLKCILIKLDTKDLFYMVFCDVISYVL